MDFLVGHAFIGSPFNISTCSRLTSHPDHRDGPQGIIALAIAAAI